MVLSPPVPWQSWKSIRINHNNDFFSHYLYTFNRFQTVRVWFFLFICFFFFFICIGCFAPQFSFTSPNVLRIMEINSMKFIIQNTSNDLQNLPEIMIRLHHRTLTLGKKNMVGKNWNGVPNAHKKVKYTIRVYVYMATQNKHTNMHTYTVDCEPLRTALEKRKHEWQMAYEWQMFFGMNFGFFVLPLDNSNLNVFIFSLYRLHLKKKPTRICNCKIMKCFWSHLVCIDSCVPFFLML